METIQLNKNSWHYKFYLFVSEESDYKGPKDICSYTRELFGLMVFLILLTMVIAGFSGTLAYFLVSLPVYSIYEYLIWGNISRSGEFIGTVAILLAMMCFFFRL